MSDEMNTPMSAEPTGVASWFSIWMEAVTKPNEQTYVKIASSSNAKASTAFLWVFIGGLVNFFVVSLVQGAIMGQVLQGFDLEGVSGSGAGFSLIAAICGAPVGAIISVVFFAMFTGVVQWVAKMFGGTGTFEQLAYVFAAIAVPFTLISSVFSLLAAIPYVGACFGLLGLVLAIYVVVLEIMAVKGVNQFGWGQAVGSFFLPGIVIFCCLGVIIAGSFSILAPAISETFTEINQGLTP
ncbi:MAG TPA: Yip1 family protein [Anaerolineales bacterium]|nr:Yip1 family protein [Anaerolineales bacterium]